MTTGLQVFLAVLGVAILSMPVYALTGARRKPDPLASDAHGTFVLGSFVRSWFYWAVDPIVRVSLAVGLGPTFFNLLGVAFGIGGGVAFATGNVTLGGWGVLLGGAADVLDGRVARALGVADRRGAFLDSTLDRFAEVGAFVGLAVLFRTSALSLVLVVTAMGGSLLVSYARARGESQGVVCNLGIMQRAERLLLVGFGGLLDPTVSSVWGAGDMGTLLVPVLGIMAVGTVGTAVFRTVWIARKLRSSN
ncbi:MAG TPA: CDP-alcohol phosphatidyltransferase family protein [Gemmatimonadetes bacterium]|nr:CDP-alcohol phosphatidyltransferase family protein [Gemmatimonadota bacterium]